MPIILELEQNRLRDISFDLGVHAIHSAWSIADSVSECSTAESIHKWSRLESLLGNIYGQV
jgi:hypothetical protein